MGDYPSEPVLEFFSCEPIERYGVERFIDVIGGEWWAADWGFEKKKKGNKIHLQLHTAGWSGNEDIICALERNKAFWVHMYKEQTGGHYWFLFEPKKIEKRGGVFERKRKSQ